MCLNIIRIDNIFKGTDVSVWESDMKDFYINW
jgi:hypothetical protein